jgi:tetratricopeptide (TPR) repeat protein
MGDNIERAILSDICEFIGQQAHVKYQYADAENWYSKALVLSPQKRHIEIALAFQLAVQRKYDEAIERFTAVAKKDESQRVLCMYSRSLLHLAKGNYYQGFKDFEYRLELPSMRGSIVPGIKRWQGEECKNLHVYGEQGFGDIFMFCRYVPLIKKKFKVEHVYFEVQDSCVDLLRYSFRNYPDVTVVGRGAEIYVHASVHCASLPYIFNTTIDTVPGTKLEVEPLYIEKWAKYKGAIGVCYSGRPNDDNVHTNEWNLRRNLPQDQLDALLAGRPVVRLQKELNSEIESWSDVAGMMANCDLVVTNDTGHAHLAGSLGVDTILVNHWQTCWRWGAEGQNTPWYGDNFKIFRQPKEWDWAPVFAELAGYLEYRDSERKAA